MPEEIFTNCIVGGPILVHVNDGKIVRIRPLVLNETEIFSVIIPPKKYDILVGKIQFSPHSFRRSV